MIKILFYLINNIFMNIYLVNFFFKNLNLNFEVCVFYIFGVSVG